MMTQEQDVFFEDFTEAGNVVPMDPSHRHNAALSLQSVTAVESIYNGRGLLSAPVAGVYRVEYADGSNSEIFVMGNPAQRDFRTARFLEKGRLSDQLSQVLKLMVRGSEGVVPETIRQRLSAYEAERDQIQTERLCG